MKKVWGLLFSILIPIAGYTQASKSDLIGLGMAPELANELVKGTVSNSSYVIQVDGDPQRKFTFDASSDTALTLKFGDSATAAQEFTIGSTKGTDVDTDILHLTGGSSASVAEGAVISLHGNEASPAGNADIYSGSISGADVTIRPIDDLIFYLSQDSNRLITFDAAADTQLDMTFGDGGTTATQIFSIGASTADADDDASLLLSGGGGKTASIAPSRGGYIQLYGNEVATHGGEIDLYSGSTSTADIILGAIDDITLQLSQDTNRLITFDSSSDTALAMQFGDGATAGQTFFVSGNTLNDGLVGIAAASAVDDTLGSLLLLYGDSAAGSGGAAILTSGDVSGADVEIRAIDDIVFKLARDSNRLITFDSSSDTDLQHRFGDGATSGQIYSIGSLDTNGADNDYLIIGGGGTGVGGTDNSRGAFLQLQGNESSGAGDLILSTGNIASSAMFIDAAAAAGTIALQVAGSTKFTVNATGELIGAGTATLGWAVVDGADDTACSTQCVTPAVFGFNLAAGATSPVIVGPSDATADICLCAGAS